MHISACIYGIYSKNNWPNITFFPPVSSYPQTYFFIYLDENQIIDIRLVPAEPNPKRV
jgi:hypothetical protein